MKSTFNPETIPITDQTCWHPSITGTFLILIQLSHSIALCLFVEPFFIPDLLSSCPTYSANVSPYCPYVTERELTNMAMAAKSPEAECKQDGLDHPGSKFNHPPDVLLNSPGG